MQETVNTLPRNSVNYSEGEIKIQFFMYTGGIKQLENESGQAWKQRINLQLLDKNLVCLMYDIAKKHKIYNEQTTRIQFPWARWNWEDLKYISQMFNTMYYTIENNRIIFREFLYYCSLLCIKIYYILFK